MEKNFKMGKIAKKDKEKGKYGTKKGFGILGSWLR